MPTCPYCHGNFSDRHMRRHAKTHLAELAPVLDAMNEDDIDIDIDIPLGEDDLGPDISSDEDGVGPAPHDIPAAIDNSPAPSDNGLAFEAEGPLPGRWDDIDLAAIAARERIFPLASNSDDGSDEDRSDNAHMDLDHNRPIPVHPDAPIPPPRPRNPLVGINEWPTHDWWPDDGALDEALDGLALSDIGDELADPANHEPEFVEQDGPLGLDPENELEIGEQELWEIMQDLLGDLAEEEWLDLYKRHITNRDRATLQILAARLRSHFSRATYNDLRLNACEELGLPSDFIAWRRLKVLSGLESRAYDCCVKSCICYLGEYRDLDQCPFCKSPRYNAAGKPRRIFNYTPLIPQLHGLFQDPTMIKNMRHRARHEAWRAENPGVMEDVFDGELYRRLRSTKVQPGDNYKYFDNPDDIALGLGTDGFSMYKRRHKGHSTAWPLILVNYNLHPSIRTRLENVICVGVIPGPTECKDINSFIVPLLEELEELASGIRSSKVASSVDDIRDDGAYFILRAFLLIIFGDIPAISKLLRLKGHNGKTPCRACFIQGVRYTLEGGRAVYYYPLTSPDDVEDDDDDDDDSDKLFPPSDLVMRDHSTFLHYYRLMEEAETDAERKKIAKECGLNDRPLFTRLGSIDLACCAPYELMHLLFENLVPNMLNHWKGQFRSLEEDPTCRVTDADWREIGILTEQATRTIPSQFVGTLPNIDIDMGLYKAEASAFWFMYLGPILLNGRLRHEHYRHYLAMRDIFIWCLDLEITTAQVDALEVKIRQWVQEYERLYYKYDYERLVACPVTIHALLHIPYYIRQVGPLPATWCFVMERFCGHLLKPALLNRVRPYEYLDNYVRRRAQMQIVARVNHMPSLLRPVTHLTLVGDELISTKEKIYDAFPDIVLGQPVRRQFHADDRLKRQVVRYLRLAEGEQFTPQQHRQRVDWDTLVRYGRFRLASMGDRVRVADMIERDNVARDNSFIRYELLPDGNAAFRNRPDHAVRVIHYGRVQDVFYVEYVLDRVTNERKPYLLARVRECATRGLDAILPENPIVTYNRMDTASIIHLETVHAAVGRVKVGNNNTWAIVDRHRGARTQFNDENGFPDPNLE